MAASLDPEDWGRIKPTVAERLKALGRDDEIVQRFADFISNKTPDPYGFAPPWLPQWRKAKIGELMSLLRRLSEYGEMMAPSYDNPVRLRGIDNDRL